VFLIRVILESDPTLIASRASMRGAETDVPFSEQNVSQFLQTTKESLIRTLLK
jgi:hypothetical protein